MISISNKGNKSYLSTSSKKFPMKNGAYPVPYAELLVEDISQLPAGTRVIVDYRKHSATHQDIIKIDELRVLSNTNVLVECTHHRCSCCWEHSLDYGKYVALVAITLNQIPAKTIGFKFDGVMPVDGEPFHVFSLEVAIGNYRDIEQQVLNIVMPELQPILDLRDTFDVQCKQQFGI